MTFETAEELLRRRDRWPLLNEAELAQAAAFGSWLTAIKDDAGLDEHFESFYAHVVENLAAETRRQIVADLGDHLEAFAREHGTCPVSVLRQWLLSDPDAGVVSTAALTTAQVMPLIDEDPLTGPKRVLGLALEMTDADRQGAIVTGLAATGDADVLALVDEVWNSLDGDATSGTLLRMGHGTPTLAVIDFLVSRLERSPESDWQGPIGHVVSSLLRLRRASDGLTLGGLKGVPDIDRLFPSWGGAEGESPIVVRDVHDPAIVGGRIGMRLQAAVAAEAYPRLLPMALRAWGVEDVPFVDAVRQAAIGTERSRLLDVPRAVQPMPDWDRDDAVITWGILNPFGPTKVQFCRVPVDGATDALVYTLHNPIAPVCLLIGTVQSGDAVSTARLLIELANRFHLGDHVLLKGLPHWVVASADCAVSVAAFFRSAHAAALQQGLTTDDDIDALVASLQRLRVDAQQEVHRQFREAMEQFGVDPPADGAVREAPAQEAYDRWVKAASDAGHVAAVSAHFLDCWNAAKRLQRDAQGV